jgi:hypothetical protein
LDPQGQLKRIDEFIPFSVGKRQCLGESLARMELFLLTANIFNQYKVKQRITVLRSFRSRLVQFLRTLLAAWEEQFLPIHLLAKLNVATTINHSIYSINIHELIRVTVCTFTQLSEQFFYNKVGGFSDKRADLCVGLL